MSHSTEEPLRLTESAIRDHINRQAMSRVGVTGRRFLALCADGTLEQQTKVQYGDVADLLILADLLPSPTTQPPSSESGMEP